MHLYRWSICSRCLPLILCRAHFYCGTDHCVSVQIIDAFLVGAYVAQEDRRENVPHHGDCNGSVTISIIRLRIVAVWKIRGQHLET